MRYLRRLIDLLVILASLSALVNCSPKAAKPVNVIAGFVFRDLNNNGIREQREPGEPNILVTAYDGVNNVIATATSNDNGEYQLQSAAITADQTYSVIFSGWNEPLLPGPQGPDSGTEVQFATGGNDNINFGLQNPDSYIQPDAPTGEADQHSKTETASTSSASGELQYQGATPASEFPTGLDWFNVTHPLTLKELRGKVVILQFWTYGCVTSDQDLFKLEMLQSAFPNEVVVIGVHANKFPHEGESANIADFIKRYGVAHPVVNDNEYKIASQYGANVWPTYVLIAPNGNFLGKQEGKLKFEQWQPGIAEIIREFDKLGQMDHAPLTFASKPDLEPASALRYPSNILADESGGRLFIADSGHNRIVVTDLDGVVIDVIGSGEGNWKDGSFAESAFLHPQGLALADENTIYIADTENQLIRRVDLAARTVSTVAGVNERVYIAADEGVAIKSRLSFPWGLLYKDGLLYVSMMGQHQIWIYNPQDETMSVFAGTGAEQLIDGPRLTSGMNQPTALTTDGKNLFFTDSEASAIRQVDLKPAGVVNTIVGRDFFTFGDVDGKGDDVLLQRPSGIAYYAGLLYVSDTYNNKIKIINPQTRESTTYLGAETKMNEPAGLSIADNILYIADMNNHSIRVVDLSTNQGSTLSITDPQDLLQ